MKRYKCPYCKNEFSIREQDPLKQGLKLKFGSQNDTGTQIREQDPLKQGLKLAMPKNVYAAYLDSRARSTKTRIETNGQTIRNVVKGNLRARSTKTRIETYKVHHYLNSQCEFASKIH